MKALKNDTQAWESIRFNKKKDHRRFGKLTQRHMWSCQSLKAESDTCMIRESIDNEEGSLITVW